MSKKWREGPKSTATAAADTSLSLEDLQALAESTTLEDAAARLGINATTLWRKRKRYGIE
jgi:transcriptional regulator of acetoin/glycerol metabolism